MQLVIKSGPRAGEQFEMGNRPVTLGTDPASEIVVPDAQMAGQHARFETIGSTLYVTDLASDKGTYLNGQRMSPAARYPLRPGDALQIGSTQFQVLAPTLVSAPVAAPIAAMEAPTSDVSLLQPYQYQLSTSYTSPPPTPAAPAQPQFQASVPMAAAPAVIIPKKRKINWSAIIATIFVLGLLGGAIFYFVTTTNNRDLEINNQGQVTRTPGRLNQTSPTAANPTEQPTVIFRAATPGIGGDKPITPVQVGSSDLPVYPGAKRIDSSSTGVFFTQYVTSDTFAQLSSWAPQAFTDKGWTNVAVAPLPGSEGAILTGKKGNLSVVTYLLGPGQKDTSPYDNFFKSANVDPNGAVVVINITNQ